jgi:uncharacterized RDD family membrane protein YckC
MIRSLNVRTPESIAFTYELAGLGTRFLAVALDLAIQVALITAIFWGLVLLGTHGHTVVHPSHRAASAAARSIAIALIVGIVFLVFFGYFILFEAFWNGQTPGKKLLGIRVIRDGGYPIDFGAAAIRNLIRVGEAAVGFYALSAAASILSPENKRLGDLAAGTIVVREAKAPGLASVVADAANVPRSALLTDEEHTLIERFVARRASLSPEARTRIAGQIAQRVRSRVSYDLQSLPDEELLIRLSA